MFNQTKFNKIFLEDAYPEVPIVEFNNTNHDAIARVGEARCNTFEEEFSSYFENMPPSVRYYDTHKKDYAVISQTNSISAQCVAKIHDCKVIGGTSLILDSANNVIADMYGSKANFFENMVNYGSYFGYKEGNFTLNPLENPALFRQGKLDKPVWVSTINHSPILLSCDHNDQCISHWIYLVCYRIYRARIFLKALDRPIFVTTTTIDKWQIDLLRLIVPEFQDTKIETIDALTIFDKLIIPIQTWESWYDGLYWNHLKNISPNKKYNKRYKKKIYISRSDAKTRRLLMTEEFRKLLNSLSFDEIIMTEYEVEEQINILNSADYIITIGGSHQNLAPFFSSAIGVVSVLNAAHPENYPWTIGNYVKNFLVVEAKPCSYPSHPNDDLLLESMQILKIKDFFYRLEAHETRKQYSPNDC